MKTLKSIRVVTVFKLSLVLGGAAGILVGLILAIASFASKNWAEGALTLVLAPLLYGVMGAIVNALMAFLYNLVAARLGGIEIELE